MVVAGCGAAAMAVGSCAAAAGGDRNVVFPKDAGIVNVREYGAKGDGVTDDTAAIRRALDSKATGKYNHVTVYLPNGTYLVSDTLQWRLQKKLQGQSRSGTVIRLKDGAAGFASGKGKAVVRCYNSINASIGNFIQDLTVDTGSGNPKARGVDFSCHNLGAMRRVTIRSGDGQGAIGLNMAIPDIGPCLVQDVLVEGFDTGIATHRVYQVTLERISVRKQRVCGFRNACHAAVRGFTSANNVPAIDNSGFLVLLDGSFSGGKTGTDAIVGKGTLYGRNLAAKGYRGVAPGHGETVAELLPTATALFPSGRGHLKLPVADPPAVPREEPAAWTRVTTPDEFQSAIDNGATTLYIPHTGSNGSSLRTDRTIVIRNKLRRIVGLHNHLRAGPGLDDDAPLLRFENTVPVVVEDLYLGRKRYWSALPGIDLANTASVTLLTYRGPTIRSVSGARGDVFLEDIGAWLDLRGQRAFVRQFNPEGYLKRKHSDPAAAAARFFANDGGALWILGVKTEGGMVVAETTGGGRTEVLGLWALPNEKVPPGRPMFISHESSTSLSFTEVDWTTNGKTHAYRVLVRETRDGTTRELKRAGGVVARVPLFPGFPAASTPVPPE
jgi:hypothetical protein